VSSSARGLRLFLQAAQRSILCLFVLAPAALADAAADTAQTQEYSFDTSGLDKGPFDYSASMELWPTLIFFKRDSDLYLLRYDRENPAYSDVYRLRGEAGAQYQYRNLLASAFGSYDVSYYHLDDSTSSDARLYECYLKYAPDVSFSLLAGKKAFRWGKAYAYNAVSFAGRQRDLNDIDAALEGYWNLSAEYIRGFSGKLSSLAFTGAVLPVYGSVNEGFMRDKTIAGVTQLYVLLIDTDIDGYLYGDSRNTYRAGADFAKNIFPSWEIHGEWAYARKSLSTFYADNGVPTSDVRNASSLVLGTRYLAPSNTTFILEYLHLGSGLTSNQMSAYYRALDSALESDDPAAGMLVLQNSARYYNVQFLMTDYLYMKAAHPEPFTILYFNPAVYSVVNLIDGSLMVGAEMTYTRLRHLLLTARYVAFAGSRESEYGVKQAQQRIELRGKWSF
jgi:hypothetical protein